MMLQFNCVYDLITKLNLESKSEVNLYERSGRVSRSGLTQDIKMGSCVFQCDIPHQWIAQ